MVLIDSTSPTTPAARPGSPPATPTARGAWLCARVAARLGLGRLYSATAYDSLPAPSRDEVRATISTATTLRSTIDEFAQASTSTQEAGELRDFEAKPLVVLTAGDGGGAAWFAKQDRLARLSNQHVAPGRGRGLTRDARRRPDGIGLDHHRDPRRGRLGGAERHWPVDLRVSPFTFSPCGCREPCHRP